MTFPRRGTVGQLGLLVPKTQDQEVRAVYRWPSSQTPGRGLLGLPQGAKGTLLMEEWEIQSSFQHITTTGKTNLYHLELPFSLTVL